MPKESKFYLNKERMRPAVPNADEQERIQTSREKIGLGIEQLAQTAGESTIEFSPEMKQFIADERTWYEKGFRRLGIEQVTWGEYMFKVPEINAGTVGGNSGWGITKISDLSNETIIPVSIEEAIRQNQFLPLEVPDEIISGIPKEEAAKHLRDYIEALYIAHELYHDSSPTSVFIQTETNETTGEKQHSADSLSPDRSGVHYVRHTKEGEAPAIEEGLAMTLQRESEKLAAQHFPEGAQIYAKLLDYIVEEDPRLSASERSNLSIRNFDGTCVKYGTMQYMKGYLLTRYLSQQIPDFFKLIEQARINGKTLPLARAIREKFGRESYAKIFTAGDSEALKVLEELEEKERSRQQ